MNRSFAMLSVTVDNGPEQYGATRDARGSRLKPQASNCLPDNVVVH